MCLYVLVCNRVCVVCVLCVCVQPYVHMCACVWGGCNSVYVQPCVHVCAYMCMCNMCVYVYMQSCVVQSCVSVRVYFPVSEVPQRPEERN